MGWHAENKMSSITVAGILECATSSGQAFLSQYGLPILRNKLGGNWMAGKRGATMAGERHRSKEATHWHRRELT